MHCLQRNVKRVVRIDVKKAGGGALTMLTRIIVQRDDRDKVKRAL